MRALTQILACLLVFITLARGQGIDSSVVVSEINYHLVGGGDTQWIELHCLSGVKVDLTGWSLGGDVSYKFPTGTVINGRGYLVVAANPSAATLGGGALGPLVGSLTNNSEIQIINANGRVMDDVKFQDDVPWPNAADGSGATLSKRNVNSADPTYNNWTWSASTGGTPGAANFSSAAQPDASPTIIFNEISAGGSSFKLELANLTAASIDVTGMLIKSTTGSSYTIPAQSIGANGFLVLTAAQLGFTPVSGDKLFLVAANGTSVLDAHKVTGKLRGRFNSQWGFPTTASFGSANLFTVSSAIVINEIMYHPRQASAAPFAASTEQWVELYNRSAVTVDLSKWQLADGIKYTFPTGATLAAGAYLVISNDSATLKLKWPGVASKIIGNFTKKLSGKGDRVELDDAAGNQVNAVAFSDGGRWPAAADGDGSSLELRDPRADNTIAEAWGASGESGRGSWQTFSWQGKADNFNGDPTQWNEFIFGLLEEGTYLIDDISVIQDASDGSHQLIENPDFENGTSGWRCLGTQSHVSVINDPSGGNGKVLQVVSTGATEHMHNHIETTLKSGGQYVGLNGSDTYHISFRARWVSGSNQLNARLYFNRLAQTVTLPVANGGGTPGLPNSDAVSNLGPTCNNLSHSPAVPTSGNPATVSVTAADPDGVGSLTLFYSVNGAAFNSTAMTLQNGIYSGVVPGQSSGAKVQFYILATDSLGNSTYFPADGPNSRAMIPWQDGQALLAVNGVNPTNIRIVMTPADITTLHTVTNVMSNDPMPCTVILDESTVFYNCMMHLHGSEHGRDQDTRVSFHINFPADQKLYGAHKSVVIDRSGAGNQTSQKEMLIKHGITHAGGIPGPEDDICRVIAPLPQHTGPAIFSKEYYDSAYLDGQYSSGSDGNLFKFELIYSPLTTTGGVEGLKIPEPDGIAAVNPGNLGADKELYRWHWMIENNEEFDDYSGIMTMLNAYGRGNDAQYYSDMATMLDVNEWLRCYAVENLFGIGDNYGGDGFQHNFMTYRRPSDGKWLFMPYDMDFTFNNNPNGGLVNTSDLSKLIGTPGNARLYYAHLRDLCQTTFNSSYLQPWAAYYSKFLNEDLTGYMGYVDTRNASVMASVNSAVPQVGFAITTPSNTNFNSSFATIQGTAWLDVATFKLSGATIPLTVTWLDNTTWQVSLPIVSGPNTFTINAYDSSGNLIGSQTITVIGGGPLVPAAAGNLVISELMYHPGAPSPAEVSAGHTSAEDFEFVELQNITSSTLDLTGVTFSAGITYSFASGTLLAPNARLLVASSNSGFILRYGSSLPLAAGQYGPATQLSNSGEQVALSDAGGHDIVRFTYSDSAPWPAGADGTGYSLVLMNSGANPDPNVATNWRLSATLGGNPGTSDATTFSGNANADDDHNGVTNFVQYALAGSAPYAGPQFSINAGGLVVYQYHINLAADDVIVSVQTSTDLSTWSGLPAGYSMTDYEPAGNGTGLITITGPAPTENKRFFRLNITTRP